MSHTSNTLTVDESQEENEGHFKMTHSFSPELNLIKPRAGSRQSLTLINATSNEVVCIEGRLTVSF